jgi:hypothetical protein
MVRPIDDLLNISRIASGKIQLQRHLPRQIMPPLLPHDVRAVRQALPL